MLGRRLCERNREVEKEKQREREKEIGREVKKLKRLGKDSRDRYTQGCKNISSRKKQAIEMRRRERERDKREKKERREN